MDHHRREYPDAILAHHPMNASVREVSEQCRKFTAMPSALSSPICIIFPSSQSWQRSGKAGVDPRYYLCGRLQF